MSTNSLIGIYNAATGTVTASYCHFDGYIAGVGATLVNHYNTGMSAHAVATGGYLSSLEKDLKESWERSANEGSATEYESIEEFLSELEDPCYEYLYLWVENEGWKVWDEYEQFNGDLVSDAVVELDR